MNFVPPMCLCTVPSSHGQNPGPPPSNAYHFPHKGCFSAPIPSSFELFLKAPYWSISIIFTQKEKKRKETQGVWKKKCLYSSRDKVLQASYMVLINSHRAGCHSQKPWDEPINISAQHCFHWLSSTFVTVTAMPALTREPRSLAWHIHPYFTVKLMANLTTIKPVRPQRHVLSNIAQSDLKHSTISTSKQWIRLFLLVYR